MAKVQNTNTINIRKQLESLNLRQDNIMSIILVTVFQFLSNRQSCGGTGSDVLLQVGPQLEHTKSTNTNGQYTYWKCVCISFGFH